MAKVNHATAHKRTGGKSYARFHSFVPGAITVLLGDKQTS